MVRAVQLHVLTSQCAGMHGGMRAAEPRDGWLRSRNMLHIQARNSRRILAPSIGFHRVLVCGPSRVESCSVVWNPWMFTDV